MSRWVDADALAKALEKQWRFTLTDEFANYEVWRALEEAPSIDIVRCQDCKYRKNRIDYENDYCIQHSKVLYSSNGYCSWGEREGE